MTEPGGSNRRADATELRGLDTVDGYRLRLMALRTRIETNWPGMRAVRLWRRRGRQEEEEIASLLVALPSPLPLAAGEAPVALFDEGVTDLCDVAGRAVDAAMLLLEANSLEAIYPREVRIGSGLAGPAGSPQAEAIVVDDPSVGLLVASIIGTLEAISERIQPPGGRDVGRS
jgi:hypothetical protein